MTLSYQTAAEMATQLAEILPSGDPMRVAFEALSADDRLAWGTQATMAIDAVRWTGSAYAINQDFAWPRVWPTPRGEYRDHFNPLSHDRGYGTIVDPDSEDDGDESVANLPKRLKLAHALQAASMHFDSIGGGDGQRVEEAAQRGVTNHSSMGQSETIDLSVARRAWARLHPRAQHLMQRYRAAAVEVI